MGTVRVVSLLVICFLLAPQLPAQQALPVFITSESYSRQQPHPLAFSYNPSLLAHQEATTITVYGERLYAMPQLQRMLVAAAFPHSRAHVGIQADHFGGEAYAQTVVGAAYGRQLGEKADAGIQLHICRRRTNGYGSNTAAGARVGARFQLTAQLLAGVCLTNPAGARWFKQYPEALPATYALGFGYNASPQCFFSLETIKTMGEPVQVNAALRYKPHPRLVARAGIQSSSASWCIGIGYSLVPLQVEVLASCHPSLGITPGLMVSFRTKTGKE